MTLSESVFSAAFSFAFSCFSADFFFLSSLCANAFWPSRILSAIKVVTTLQKVNDSQAYLIAELRKDIKRLQTIDGTLKDFNGAKALKEREDFAREGFDEVCAARRR